MLYNPDEQEGASRLEQLVGIVNYLAAEPPNVWTAEWSSLIWSSGDLVTELVSVSPSDTNPYILPGLYPLLA